MMRIITGSAKGKRLETLEGEATRPTSERIKEAIFSSIQFEIEDRRVLDLFAGSGQMGLEALSRGASRATFIDSSREAMEIVKKNARLTGLDDNCHYLVSDWKNYIRKASGRDERYDLVFVDPPYAMECCAEAANYLAEKELIIPRAIVVLESGEEKISMDDPRLSGYRTIKSTHYGKKTFVNILFYEGREVSE
jgi:16S rRNA (guanine(966)-N(2))-methyltransferase RsmD